MKKVINKKTYDTETAQPIDYYRNGGRVGDFYHISEVLYRKDDGEYFLHCRGGAGTCYAKQYKNRSNVAGEHIIPITEERANEWLKFYKNRYKY